MILWRIIIPYESPTIRKRQPPAVKRHRNKVIYNRKPKHKKVRDEM